MWSGGEGWNLQLAVLVTAVALEVLADSDSLLDEVVEVLGDGGGKACSSVGGS
jgi:hypothetical protein